MNNFHRFQNFRQFSNLFSQIWLKKRHTSLFSGICREIRTKFHKKFVKNIVYLVLSANFWWIFVRISRQIPEKSDVCRFFTQICENRLENCRKFWNLWKLFNIIQYYSIVSFKRFAGGPSACSTPMETASSPARSSPPSASGAASRNSSRGPFACSRARSTGSMFILTPS